MSVGYRQGKAFNGSSFPDFGTVTGSYFASFFATPWLEIQPYGHRTIGYGLAADTPYFFDTRNGGAVNFRVHRRVELRGYGEAGTNDYAFPLVGPGPKRFDHVTEYGGGISVLLTRKLVLSAIASRVNYTSNIPGLDRTITRFTTGLSLKGNSSDEATSRIPLARCAGGEPVSPGVAEEPSAVHRRRPARRPRQRCCKGPPIIRSVPKISWTSKSSRFRI